MKTAIHPAWRGSIWAFALAMLLTSMVAKALAQSPPQAVLKCPKNDLIFNLITEIEEDSVAGSETPEGAAGAFLSHYPGLAHKEIRRFDQAPGRAIVGLEGSSGEKRVLMDVRSGRGWHVRGVTACNSTLKEGRGAS